MAKNRLTVTVAVILVVVLVLQLVAFRVRDTERALVKTFGKATRELKEPGLYWKWPWPIEEVVRQDARLRVLEGPLDETRLSDRRSVLVSCFVTWRPGQALLFLERHATADAAAQALERSLRNAQSAALGSFPFEALITADRTQLRWDEVEKRIREPLERIAREELGIEVLQVGIRRIALPKDATENVFERMRAEREVKAKEHLAKGQAAAEDIRMKAESERTNALNAAFKQEREILAEADRRSKEAHAILDEDPELAIYLRKIEALKKGLSGRTTLILDTSSWPYELLQPRSGNK